MRVVTWNCNLQFAHKKDTIEQYDADVLIIQECEKLPQDFIKGWQLFWMGNNKKKGLAVIIKGDSSFINKSFDKNFTYFLPVQSEYGLILGVWSFNHRASKFGFNSNGFVADVLNFYDELLDSTSSAIIAGDFNNNPQWDRLSFHKNNFRYISSELEQRNFESVYHKNFFETYGDESNYTFFHQRNHQKKFHIDYIFSKGLILRSCDVGSYEKWSGFSDHVPITAEFV